MDNIAELSMYDIEYYKNACCEVKSFLMEKLYQFCIMNEVDFLINSRIKDKESLRKKIDSKGNDIYDIVGIRIVFCEIGNGIISNPDKINRLTELNDEISDYSPNDLIDAYIKESKSDVNGNDLYTLKFLEFLLEQNVKIERIKNYINKPKNTGYQSLHFVICASNGRKVEVQVRNYLQHLFAEWEHTFYKTIGTEYSMDELLESKILIKKR